MICEERIRDLWTTTRSNSGKKFTESSNRDIREGYGLTHADIIAKSLAEKSGVKFAFGLPGGEISAFMDSCRRADIRVLLTGHESSAAWMAQVYGQITGIPGVCFAT